MKIKPVDLEAVWDLRHRVMYPGLDPSEVRLPDDAAGRHLALWIDARPVSVISLFNRGSEMQFRKFATETAEQGKGYGSALLEHVITLAAKEKKTAIWCNARLTATALYARHGMRAFGETWEQYGIGFVKMKKEYN